MKIISLLTLFLASKLAAAEPSFDWSSVSDEIRSCVKERKNDTPEFSRKLEGWFSELKYPVTIDIPRENFGYMLALLSASAPESEFKKIRLPDGFTPKTRYDLFLYMAKKVDCQKIPFDEGAWQRLSPHSDDRYKMIKSYLNDHKIIESDPNDIKAALGPPTSDQEDSFCYILGPDPSTLAPASVWIYFDVKDQKVTKFFFRGD